MISILKAGLRRCDGKYRILILSNIRVARLSTSGQSSLTLKPPMTLLLPTRQNLPTTNLFHPHTNGFKKSSTLGYDYMLAALKSEFECSIIPFMLHKIVELSEQHEDHDEGEISG